MSDEAGKMEETMTCRSNGEEAFVRDGSMMGLDITMTVLQPSLEHALHRIRVIAQQGGASDDVRERYEAEAQRLWRLAWPDVPNGTGPLCKP